MRRGIVVAVLLWALAPGTVPAATAGARVGFLSPSTPAASARAIQGFREGLRAHGLVEGSNLTVELRFAGGRFDRLPDLARELVRLRVDVLVTVVTQASLAARAATSTIPIVMVGVADPVAAGLVASLARPGGNVTGTSSISVETAGKTLELLREIAPGARRVAILWNPANRLFQVQMVRATEAAAEALGLEIVKVGASDLGTIDRAFEEMARTRVEALDVLPDPTFAAHSARISALATRGHLPSVSGDVVYAEAGGLLAYSPSFLELHRRAADYVARILRGARPADLPVEQPTRFELVVNRKTARELAVTVPPSLLLRADRTIE